MTDATTTAVRDEDAVLIEYRREITLREYDEMRHTDSAMNISARYHATDVRAMARRILSLESQLRACMQYQCRHLNGCYAHSPDGCRISLGLGSQR